MIIGYWLVTTLTWVTLRPKRHESNNTCFWQLGNLTRIWFPYHLPCFGDCVRLTLDCDGCTAIARWHQLHSLVASPSSSTGTKIKLVPDFLHLHKHFPNNKSKLFWMITFLLYIHGGFHIDCIAMHECNIITGEENSWKFLQTIGKLKLHCSNCLTL